MDSGPDVYQGGRPLWPALPRTMELFMAAHTDVLKTMYKAFETGDVATVLATLADDVSWTEAEGFPYGGTYIGHNAVIQNVFMRLMAEWDNFAVAPQQYVEQGDMVVALGEYSGSYKATGKAFRVPFAHVWTFANGKAAVFRQLTDTYVVRQTMV